MLSAVLILSSCWNTAIIKVIKKSEVIRPRKPLNLKEISGQQELNLRPHGPSRARYQATPYPVTKKIITEIDYKCNSFLFIKRGEVLRYSGTTPLYRMVFMPAYSVFR